VAPSPVIAEGSVGNAPVSILARNDTLIRAPIPPASLINVRPVPEVVAARAATGGSEYGAVGGAAGPGSVRHSPEKEGALPLLFPPAVVAIWEDDHAVVGDCEGTPSLVPVLLQMPHPHGLAFLDERRLARLPGRPLNFLGVIGY